MTFDYNKIEKNPHKFGVETPIPKLVKLLDEANQKYRQGDSPISDDTYDIILESLQSRDPNNPYLKQIGAPVRDDIIKETLPFWMGSMDKVKPNTRELDRFLSKFSGPYCLSEKLDGLSGLLVYNIQKPNTTFLYTRGNGTVGQNISHLLKSIKIPKITTKFAVRGEFIIERETFQKKYSNKFPKARSLVAGTINAKQPDPKILADIDFVAYEIIQPSNFTPETQFNKLSQIGFKTAANSIASNLNTDTLKQILLDMKSNSKYEIDGVIVADNKVNTRNKSGNPKYAVAFKMPLQGQTATTTVLKVEWNPSKHGVLVPRIQFKPVKIGGDTISFATGFNAKYVKDNKIGPGAMITILRSGDVIPYIQSVNKPSNEELFPNVDYQWNKSGIDIVLKNMEDSIAVKRKRLLHFFTTLKVTYLSEGLIGRLVENKFSSISAICQMTVGDFLSIPGFKDRMANKIHKSIHDIIDNPIPLHTLMTASNSFGTGFGEKKLLPLIDMFPNKWDKLQKNDILRVEGFSDKTTSAYLKGLPNFLRFLEEHPFLEYQTPKKQRTKSKETPLTNKNIVLTGFRDKTLEVKIQDMGGKINNTVSSNTNIVVAKDVNSKSSKLTKAKANNIPILSLEQFLNKYF